MATKDWKLIGKKLGRNHDVVEWVNKKTKEMITYIGSIGILYIRKGLNQLDLDLILRENKLKKSDAMDYAKEYMRKH